MWKTIPIEQRASKVELSRNLMLDLDGFLEAMKKVVHDWPYSCEQNLTASVVNHQAWLGHAACAINHDAPEDLTRLAWATLNKEQQDLANLAADQAKAYWMENYAKN